MKVFIIGIAGRTGLRIAKLLKSQGAQVDGVYRRDAQKGSLDEAGVLRRLVISASWMKPSSQR